MPGRESGPGRETRRTASDAYRRRPRTAAPAEAEAAPAQRRLLEGPARAQDSRPNSRRPPRPKRRPAPPRLRIRTFVSKVGVSWVFVPTSGAMPCEKTREIGYGIDRHNSSFNLKMETTPRDLDAKLCPITRVISTIKRRGLKMFTGLLGRVFRSAQSTRSRVQELRSLPGQHPIARPPAAPVFQYWQCPRPVAGRSGMG